MSADCVIRPAREDELEEILAIENASFTCPWSRQSFLDAFAGGPVTIYAAERDGVLVGFSCLLTIGEEAEILNIAAAPDHRHEGVGGLLLTRMLDDAEESGAQNVYLEVRASNTPARSLYKKAGFSEIGIRRHYYTKPREDAILMKKAIFPEDEGHL